MAAGSVKELPITFRPADFVPYSDFIELETSQKNYRIKLQAKIQTPKFSIPDKIDIGPCAVKEKKYVVKVFFVLTTFGYQMTKIQETEFQKM